MMNSNGIEDVFPITDGLIVWLDGRDGATGDTCWVNRVNQSVNMFFKTGGIATDFVGKFENGYYVSDDSSGILTLEEPLQPPYSILIFSEQLDWEKNLSYCRFFDFKKIETNSSACRVENGTAGGGIFYIGQNGRDTSIIKPYLSYDSVGKANLAFTVKEDKDSWYFNSYIRCNESIGAIRSGGGINHTIGNTLLLNRESLTYSMIKPQKYGAIYIYNRELSEEEIDSIFEYEQSIERGE